MLHRGGRAGSRFQGFRGVSARGGGVRRLRHPARAFGVLRFPSLSWASFGMFRRPSISFGFHAWDRAPFYITERL